MRTLRLLTLLAGLGLLFSVPAFAQQTAPEPLLVAHLRALDRTAASAAPPIAAARSPRTPGRLRLETELWSASKAVAVSAPSTSQRREPAPRVSFAVQKDARPLQVSVVPFPLTSVASAYSRARGPFEQVYPRPW